MTNQEIHLGQKVQTPDGVGIVVQLNMPWNLIYHDLNLIRAVVVYENAVSINGSSKFFSFTYDIKDLKPNCYHADEWTNLNGGDYWCPKCCTYEKQR